MTIPDPTLKRWRELAERAVPGPWRVSIERLTKRAVVFDANDMWVADCGEDPDGARLIAEARTALPALLDLVAQLTRERDEAVKLVAGMRPVVEAAESAADAQRLSDPSARRRYENRVWVEVDTYRARKESK